MARSNHLANFAICYVRRVSAALFGSDANQFSSKLGLGSDWSNLGHKPGQFGTGTNWFDSDGTLADYPASGRVSQGGQVRYLPYFVRLLDTIYITFRNTTFRVFLFDTQRCNRLCVPTVDSETYSIPCENTARLALFGSRREQPRPEEHSK